MAIRVASGIVGVIAIFLGGLWLVQGLGLVTIKPVACIAKCEALEGPSVVWAIIGGVVVIAGAGLVGFGLRRRRR